MSLSQHFHMEGTGSFLRAPHIGNLRLPLDSTRYGNVR